MRIATKRRLERLEARLSTIQRVLVLHQQSGETCMDMDARLEQWKAGEPDTGIDGTYEGGELQVLYVCFVEPDEN